MATEIVVPNDEDFNIDQKATDRENEMTGKDLYKELRANMSEFGITITKWKHLTSPEKLAWKETANDITAGLILLVSANRNQNKENKSTTNYEPEGTGPMGF